MPYKISQARKDFDETLEQLTKAVKKAALKKNFIPNDIVQMTFRSAIFQCSAALEQYVSDILNDWIFLAKSNEKTYSKIPETLRLLAVAKRQLDAFKHFIAYGDEKALVDKISRNVEIKNILQDEETITEVLSYELHISDKKYPSVRNLKSIFKRFGVENIFHETQSRGNKNYTSIIQSFSDIRTEIAHQNFDKYLTAQDVKSNLNNIKSFVNNVDRVIFSKVVNSSGIECWKCEPIS